MSHRVEFESIYEFEIIHIKDFWTLTWMKNINESFDSLVI